MRERPMGRNVRAVALNMHGRQPSRGEPRVLLRHTACTHASWQQGRSGERETPITKLSALSQGSLAGSRWAALREPALTCC